MDLSCLKLTEKRRQYFEIMNIQTIEQLLYCFPYKYDIIEESYPTLENEHIIIEATIISGCRVFFNGKMSRMVFSVEDKYHHVYQVTIFNRHFLRTHLRLSTTITIIGKAKDDRIVASDIKLKTLKELEGIHPMYSLKQGMTQKTFQSIIKKALQIYEKDMLGYVPEKYIIKHQLIHKNTALWNIHFPSSQEDVKQALKYLKYEEFLKFQLTMQFIKKQRNKEIGIKKQFDISKFQDFILSLPYQLTKDQQTVVKEILQDLQSSHMMYRFLQGDVGSGKTVVSALALYANALSGFQGALMAPTEILARQHYETLTTFFRNVNIRIVLLVGSLSLKEKNEVYKKIQSHEVDIIVGTHALFQKKVEYANLGLVITDEQHRFGVEQRKALKNKGNQVDFLIMSATPIPRTLAISMYGDMDVSTIKTMPHGRKPIITKYVRSSSMKPILSHLKEYLASNGQCYVICPLVDESDAIDARSASKIAQAMQKYFYPHYCVGLLHGQMKDEEKEKVMQDFQDNRIQILVSTTVVEVGVDVKNANMMIVYNAERFGMSQLHQLRGRVGRSDAQAYCYFMSSSTSKEAIERLKYMEQSQDGFEISMYDLKMRGPGEVLGQRQSGLPTFLVGDLLKDFPIVRLAREDAMEIIDDYQNKNEYKNLILMIQENLKENNEYVD